MSLSDYPRLDLLFGPSPIHPLERLTGHLGGQVDRIEPGSRVLYAHLGGQPARSTRTPAHSEAAPQVPV
jgi:1-aminocyclopropane-1-carboxylate deaminase/D-cysteine desulfhydrase-like pyridoxal-dependent ACC family enzyme